MERWPSTSTRIAGAVLLQVWLALASSTTAVGQHLHWIQPTGGTASPDYRFAHAVAVDSAGNSYVTGEFSGTAAFAPGLSLTTETTDMYLVKFGPDGVASWARRAGGTALQPSGVVPNPYGPRAYGYAIAIDGANIYVTGVFTGRDVFGVLTSEYIEGDLFVAHYDDQGGFKGAIRAGGLAPTEPFLLPNSVRGSGIAVDDSNNIYVTGVFSGTVRFGSSSQTVTNTIIGRCFETTGGCSRSDMFVAKYRNGLSSDTPDWFQQAGGGTLADAASASGIALDQSSNSYVIGVFRGTADFRNGVTFTPDPPSQDVFVAKFNRDGVLLPGWPRQYGGPSDDTGNGITVARDGSSMHITGLIGGFAQQLGSDNPFLVKLDGNGDPVWTRGARFAFTGGGFHPGTAIAVDTDGNSYVTGAIGGGSAPASTLTLSATTGSGIQVDVFPGIFSLFDRGSLIRHVTTGLAVIVDVRCPAPPCFNSGEISVDILEDFDNTTLTIDPGDWTLVRQVDFARPSEPAVYLDAAGFSDMFTASYDLDGNLRWVTQGQGHAAAGAGAAGTGIAIDGEYNTFVTGNFRGMVNFGGGYVDGEPVLDPRWLLTSAGTEDVFVARYGLEDGEEPPPTGNTEIGTDRHVAFPGNGAGVLGVELTFENVTRTGDTNVTYAFPPNCPTIPFGYLDPFGCIVIDTTASFEGTIKIEIHYDPNAVSPPLTLAQEQNLKLWHFYDCGLFPGCGEIINDPEESPNPDTGQHVIYGVTSHFSTFTLMLPENGAPTANAGANQTLEATGPAGASVTLSGTGDDPDGDPLTFTWSGPCGAASGASVTVTCPLGTSTMTLTVSDDHGGSATSTVQISVVDTTPPSIVCAAPDPAWHAADVLIACSASDAVGLANPAEASFVLTTNVPAGTETTAATTGSRSVCDGFGHCGTAGPIGPIKVDKKGPGVQIVAPSNGVTYALNQPVPASFSCVDGGAGIASCNGTVNNGASIDTGSEGTKSFTVTAIDAVGNRTDAVVTYHVGSASTYSFQGFFAPIDMSSPDLIVRNTVKAGQTVPVKWLLTQDGTPVSDPASFLGLSSYEVSCSSEAVSIDAAIEETASGSSGLQYNGGGNWQYNWKTLQSYKRNTCRVVVVRFSDGTVSPPAHFRFK